MDKQKGLLCLSLPSVFLAGNGGNLRNMAMWDAIKRMGFKGGKVLEPSMGVGNFIGLMPNDVYKKSHVTGIELDGITARIAKLLYPKQTILSQGFETAKLRDGSFDLAISNVPFGDYKLHDTRYAKHNLFIHDYFITRALDLVRPGGVVAFITTSGSLNSGRSMNMRQLAADKARLLGAIRLPGTSFSKNALTDVTTDILFLQRLGEGETNTSPAWTISALPNFPLQKPRPPQLEISASLKKLAWTTPYLG